MNTQKNIPDMSFYRLLLIDFLRESHPELLNDERFINARSDSAAETYEKAVQSGSNNVEANEMAHEILFQGLHFSKHDTLVNILWNEFSAELKEADAKALAIKLLPDCENVFFKYYLSDDFAYEPEYDLLYTELTGTIAIYLDKYGLQ